VTLAGASDERSIVLDVSRFPIVVTTLPPYLFDETVDEYLRQFVVEVLARRSPFVSIVDAVNLKELPSATIRKSMAEWQLKNIDADPYRLGLGIVTERRLVRGFMAVLELVYPSKSVATYHASLEVALAWAKERLRKE
jgi:hypothetical protein